MNEFRPLRADEIDVRVNTINEKGCTLLLYQDARVGMNLLDEVYGPFGWKREHVVIDGKLCCTVSIRNPETGEWVGKTDVGTESMTEKEKGIFSDSFKRSVVNWGLGRELYSSPFIWVPATSYSGQKRGDKYATYDRFKVSHIEYTDGNITALTIVNASAKDKKVFEIGPQKAQKQPEPAKAVNPTPESEKPSQMAPRGQNEYITDLEREDLEDRCARDHIDVNALCLLYGIFSLEETTVKQHKNMLANWDKIKEKFG